MKPSLFSTLTALASVSFAALKLPDNPTKDDLVGASNQVKENMLTFYNGNRPGGIPGYMLNPDYYFWWLTGGMLGQLIQHRALTGNDSYNQLVSDAFNWQTQDNDFLVPRNQSSSEGNDDQAFWAFAALDAAETNFPEFDPEKKKTWLSVSQGVFNSQVGRWRSDVCDGGLEWQINALNAGSNYKNTPTNSGFFLIGARLARFTGNQTYIDWANKAWDWMVEMTLIDRTNPQSYQVWDGVTDGTCASKRSIYRYTYSNAMLMAGSAYLYDLTKNQTWADHALALLKGMPEVYLVKDGEQDASKAFSDPHEILAETECEYNQGCNADQPSFKAYTLRWLTVSAQLVPGLQNETSRIMNASLKAAVRSCTGRAPGMDKTPAKAATHATPGSGNNWCGQRWWMTSWDGYSGLGEQMSALSVIQNSIIFLNGGPNPSSSGNSSQGKPGADGMPLSGNTGGTSQGNAAAGADSYTASPHIADPGWKDITGADKFGAAILTLLAALLPPACMWYLFMGDYETPPPPPPPEKKEATSSV